MALASSKRTFCIMVAITLGIFVAFQQKPSWFPLLDFTSYDVNSTQDKAFRHATESLSHSAQGRQCDVLRDMLNGTWQGRPLTPVEENTMRMFYRRVREEEHHIPPGIQRPDKKCGNVNVGTGGTLHWFRALCDADGPTPCCYGNRCVDRSKEQCTCEGCFDMRAPLHAEYSTWKPVRAECEPRSGWSVDEVCLVLKGSTLLFIGDSLVRHVFTAFLLLVRGDPITGAFSPKIPPDVRERCRGLYMFTEKVCRHWLDGYNSGVKVCNGTLSLRLRYLVSTSAAKAIEKEVFSVANKTRSLVFMGLGFHEKMNAGAIQSKVLMPLLTRMRSQSLQWPRLMWAPIHRFGMMRTPLTTENLERARQFNGQMRPFLARWRVPDFDTWLLTTGVMSFDGQHYGYGVNSVKARLLLNYVHQLQRQGRW